MPKQPNGRGIAWRKGVKGNLVPPGTAKKLTDEERSIILRLSERGKSINEIADAINRNTSVVSRYLVRFRDTTLQARMHIKSKALALAQRVVKNADVDQAIDILSRPGIDVLQPRVESNKSSNGFSLNVVASSLGGIVKVEDKHELPVGVQSVQVGELPGPPGREEIDHQVESAPKQHGDQADHQ